MLRKYLVIEKVRVGRPDFTEKGLKMEECTRRIFLENTRKLLGNY